MTMPAQKPGKSEQAVGTPKVFLEAVKRRLGIVDFAIDLAADHGNFVCEPFFTPEMNALTQRWVGWGWTGMGTGWSWLNPPFADIGPWVEKAWQESQEGACIAVLVPVATDTAWWNTWVKGKGYISFIQGRFAFVGHSQSYPKGLALVLYAPFLHGGDCSWKWAPRKGGPR